MRKALYFLFVFLAFIVATTLISCEKILPTAPESNEVLAEPIADLSPSQLALHIKGDEEFARIFSEAEGLGPVFVQNSCESCHVGDGKGNPFNNLTRFGRYDTANMWDPLLAIGGPQIQHRAISNYKGEELPPNVQSSQFIAPNVTGLGYLGAVLDADILAMSDPFDSDNDGISGVVQLVDKPDFLNPDPRYHTPQAGGKYIGRFGRKSSAIDLVQQTVGAYKQDMGITSDFDTQDPVNFQDSRFADDNVPDPEIPAATLNKVVFYLQTLEAPRRRNENVPSVIAGEAVFLKIGCESCHKSTLKTGQSEIAALDQVEFHPYTDMLLHDMGADLDDKYTEGVVETFEWRTMPLWGYGLQAESQGSQIYLLHDGRAKTLAEAINFHGGEAAASRDNYKALTPTEKQQLEVFLNSL
ncbi:MAG: CxxC motif-containing protein (DUF1111 family) [Sphingobacteriales bacterium]|jgi:CxxC motif-containing protein (DUF1111 family)